MSHENEKSLKATYNQIFIVLCLRSFSMATLERQMCSLMCQTSVIRSAGAPSGIMKNKYTAIKKAWKTTAHVTATHPWLHSATSEPRVCLGETDSHALRTIKRNQCEIKEIIHSVKGKLQRRSRDVAFASFTCSEKKKSSTTKKSCLFNNVHNYAKNEKQSAFCFFVVNHHFFKLMH